MIPLTGLVLPLHLDQATERYVMYKAITYLECEMSTT